MLKAFRAVSCAALFAALSGGAASAENVSLSGALGFESRYLFRGVQFAETSFQAGLTVGWQGFYVGGWANLPVGDDLLASFGGEEIDLVAGYSAEIAPGATLDVGVTYYTFPNLDRGFFDTYAEDGDGLGSNTLEPYIGVAFDAPLSPKLYVYRDFMFDTFTVQGSLAQSVPLGGKFSLDLAGIAGYVIDDDPGGDYLYGHASANVSYAFNDRTSLYAGARFGGSDIAGGAVFDDASLGTTKASGFWFGVGLTTRF